MNNQLDSPIIISSSTKSLEPIPYIHSYPLLSGYNLNFLFMSSNAFWFILY